MRSTSAGPPLALLAALASCGHGAAPEAAAGGSARASSPAAGSPAPAPAASIALPATREGDGCWGVDLPAAPPARLEALGARCAPGLRRLFDEAHLVTMAAGDAVVQLPALPPGACLRAAAVSNEGVVALALVEGPGDEAASDANAAFSLVPLDGPLCVGPEGRAALRLRRPAAPPERPAAGRAWVQAWASAPARK